MKKELRLILVWLLASTSMTCGQTLRSAAEPDYPPFSVVNPDGSVGGFSVDLLKAVTEAMGREITFKTAPWDQIKTELAEGDLDVLPLVGITQERQALYDFTAPYITMHGALFVRKDCTNIQSLADLPGKRIAVMKGDNAEEYVLRKKLSDNVVSTTTFKEAFQLLAAGQADAVIAQKRMGVSLLNELGIKNIRIVGPPNQEFKQTFCFAVRKEKKGLLSLLNEGLAMVYADGTYQRIYLKWLGSSRSDVTMAKVTLVGSDRNYPPYEFLNEQGVPDGFNVELTRAIAESMGLSVEFRLDAWPKVVTALEEGAIDAIIDMAHTPERAKFFDFTTPHVTTYSAVYSGPKSPKYLDLSSLRNRRVAVQAAGISEKNLKNSAPEAIPVLVDAEVDALERLARNEVDFALVLRPAADWIIKNKKLRGLHVAQNDLYRVQSGFAVQKGNDELIQLFEEGFRRVKASGEYDRLRKKWLGVENVHFFHIIKPYVIWGLATLCLLMLLTALWIYTLKKQVHKKTASLRESEQRFEIAASAGGIGIWDWDIVHDQLLWDTRMHTLYGIPPGESGKTVDVWRKTLYPEDRDQAEHAIQTALSGDAEFNTEYRIIRPDGEVRHIRAFGKTIRDSKENPLRMIGTNQDITDRKQAETELKKSEAKFRATINGLQVGVVVHAADSSIVLSNPQACHILGLSEEQLSGKKAVDPTWSFVYEDLSVIPVSDYPVSQVITTGKRLLDQVLGIQRPDRTEVTWVIVSAVPLFTEKNELNWIIVNFMDISDRKKAEAELLARNLELERFNNATVGRELRMIELKQEINELCRELGRKEPYPDQPSIPKES